MTQVFVRKVSTWGLRAVRVGEVSHPGPSTGQRNRRHQSRSRNGAARDSLSVLSSDDEPLMGRSAGCTERDATMTTELSSTILASSRSVGGVQLVGHSPPPTVPASLGHLRRSGLRSSAATVQDEESHGTTVNREESVPAEVLDAMEYDLTRNDESEVTVGTVPDLGSDTESLNDTVDGRSDVDASVEAQWSHSRLRRSTKGSRTSGSHPQSVKHWWRWTGFISQTCFAEGPR